MPRLSKSLPKYGKHRGTGQAVVTIDGHDIYLGKYGSRTSRAEYDRIIAEYIAAGRKLPPQFCTNHTTVVELIVQFLRFAKTHYRKNGRRTRGDIVFRDAAKPLKRLYGRKPVTEFGPLALKAVREAMIEEDLARRTINDRSRRRCSSTRPWPGKHWAMRRKLVNWVIAAPVPGADEVRALVSKESQVASAIVDEEALHAVREVFLQVQAVKLGDEASKEEKKEKSDEDTAIMAVYWVRHISCRVRASTC